MAEDNATVTNTQDNTEVKSDHIAEVKSDSKEEGAKKDGQEEAKSGEPKGLDTDNKEEPKAEDKKAEEKVEVKEYEAFKLPKDVELNKDVLNKFTDLAKGLSLSQEDAQKLIDIASENVSGVVKAQSEAWTKTRDQWVTEIKADKDFGGSKFDETVERAQRTLKAYGSEKLLSFLDSTGYGDNPDIIRMLARIDKAVSEDKTVNGSPNSSNKSAADILYGK